MIKRSPPKRLKYRWLIYSDVDREVRRKIAKEVKNVSKKIGDLDILELIKFTALFVTHQGSIEIVADMLMHLVSNNYEDLSDIFYYRYNEAYKIAMEAAKDIVLEIKSKRYWHESNVKDVDKIINLYKVIDSNISIIFLEFIDSLYSLQEK